MVVLGSPVGHTDFVHAWAVNRLLEEEQQLLQQLPQLPDLQCSWLLLALCVLRARTTHSLPAAIASYAAGHDDAIWHRPLDCLGGVAGAPPGDAHLARGDRFPASSVRWLRSAVGDALGTGGLLGSLGGRLASQGGQAPSFAAHCVETLPRGGRHGVPSPCGGCPHVAPHGRLGGVPHMAACSRKPTADPTAEPQLGEWPHGWQQHASRTRNLYFRDRVLLPSLTPARRAVLRRQSGPHAGAWLSAIPGTAARPPASTMRTTWAIVAQPQLNSTIQVQLHLTRARPTPNGFVPIPDVAKTARPKSITRARQRQGCKRVRPSSRSWTTTMSCQHRSAPMRCTAPWRTRCGAMRAYA